MSDYNDYIFNVPMQSFFNHFFFKSIIICLHTKQFFLISKINLAILVEGDQKAPFSIATTQRSREGCYSFPWIAPLPLIHILCWVLSKETSSTSFESLVWQDLGFNPNLPSIWWTLTARPMDRLIKNKWLNYRFLFPSHFLWSFLIIFY